MRIDVLIPVFNALSQTARCVESVLRYSRGSFRLILVNDASDEATTTFLRTAAHHPNVVLLENESNLGFVKTANRGMRHALDALEPRPDAIVLLNSDTVVSEGWLERYRECFAADRRIGIATAVSNNAENLSVKILPGYDIARFAKLVETAGRSIGYPDITTAIGFCMGIRRELLEKIGVFDEIFGRGYGEDSDYHFRALAAGFRSVLLSTCFVYHESHASFSEQAKAQITKNRPIFDRRWLGILHNELERQNTENPVGQLAEAIAEAADPSYQHDVLFILPTPRLFGGVIVVYELVNRLLLSGVDAGVIIANGEERIEMDLCFAPYFIPPTEWRASLPKARCYVATHFETCAFAFAAAERYPDSRLVYLIQGYESWYPGAVIEKVVDSYRAIPRRIVVSGWLVDMLDRWSCQAQLLPNGVDTKWFTSPADRFTPARQSQPVRVFTLLRKDPQGGWRFTFSVIERLKKLRPDCRIVAVGELVEHPEVRGFIDEPHLRADRKEMRKLYQSVDIFFDSSMIQGFGMMGLEAMASGVALVTSDTGGVREYATEENSVLVPIGNPDALVHAIVTLIDDGARREAVARAGLNTARRMDWEKVTAGYAEYFQTLLNEPDGAPSADELDGRRRFFLNDHLRTVEHENWLLQAIYHLEGELQKDYVPDPAGDVFSGCGRSDLLEKLQRFPAGRALLRLYDEAVKSSGRSATHGIGRHEPPAGEPPIFERIRAIVPRTPGATRTRQNGVAGEGR